MREGPWVFDGSDHRVSDQYASVVTGNSARTVVVSIKTTVGDTIPFSLGAGSGVCNGHWAIAPRADAWAVYGRCASYDEHFSVSVNVIDGTWHRIAVTWEPSSRHLRAYADGVEVGSYFLRGHGEAYTTQTGYYIGGWVNADRFYDGSMRGIEVYDVVMPDVAALTAPLPLVPVFTVAETLTFDGTDQRITSTSPPLLIKNSARTIILSIKTTVGDTIPFSLGAGSGVCNGHWAIAPRADAWAVYGRCASYDEHFSVSVNVIDGVWHRIAVSFAPSSRLIRAYADGVEVAQALTRNSDEAYTTAPGYYIGGWANADRFYDGQVRNITVYDDALPSDQLAALTL